MEDPYSRLHVSIRDANLPKSAEKTLLEIFTNGIEKIPLLRALKLMKLLSHLRFGQFRNLSTIEKKELLENFFDLLKFRKEKSISRICFLFFEGEIPKKKDNDFLPQEMIKALIMVGRIEKAQSIKEMIWGFLIQREIRLEKYISPDELIFGLWLDNPVFRNNIIKFLFRHFKPEPIVHAIITYISKTGKTIPGQAFRRFIGLAKEEETLKQKRHLLTDILKSSQLTNKDIDRVWSDYLKSLNRFELIKMFLSNSRRLNWIEDLKEKSPQLSFGFKPQEETSNFLKSFHSRVSEIQKNR